MKTIEKILEYKLTSEEISCLEEAGIINGCGGKGGYHFDKILRDNLELIPGFDKEKAFKLFTDIKLICFEHDIDFRFKKGFIKSNFKMGVKIFKLLYWCPFKYRFSIASIVFVLLTKYGKKFYNS